MTDAILFAGLSLQAWITIVTILIMFGILMFTKLPADLVFMGGMAVLLVSGVLTPAEALSGFSSPSVVIVGVLFVVVAGLVYTGVIHVITRYMLGAPKTYSKAVIRLMLPVAALSAFLSNTTVVTLFLNVVKVWSKKLGIAPSKLLIPLSYASGMGGVCTLIGTPPNLIISGFYTGSTGEQLNMFATALPGLFCLFVGVVSVLALSRLLPVRKTPEESFESSGEYTVELLVPTDNPHIGETVKEAGLTEVKGGHLIEIIRFDKEIISPVRAEEFVMGGDRLVYSGQIEELLELKHSHALVNAPHHVFSINEIGKGRKLLTATVPAGSDLIGRTISETDFESRSGAVLVAVSRKGERINESPREINFRFGDTLLLECPAKVFNKEAVKDKVVFFESEDIPNTGKKTFVSSMIMTAMVLLSAFNIMPLLQSCFLAAFAMLATRCLSIDMARRSINWYILMIFAGSVCLGAAIEKTGLAVKLADAMLGVCGDNPLVVLGCICLLGTFLTEFISNTACAAMLYPITYSSALALGVNPLTFCIALMVAVSSSFATPIGSPTHMLVYGPGGYRFSDFMKIGLPMNIIILAANLFIVLILFPL